MKLLIDMNLSPKWVSILEEAGWKTVHWSHIGQPDAPDHEILRYARTMVKQKQLSPEISSMD